MPNVLELTRILSDLLAVSLPNGVILRTVGSGGSESADVADWLDLRRRVFADEHPPVRDWSAVDFAREITAKPWWRPEHCWLAFDVGNERAPVGSAMLAQRVGRRATQAVLHWLMVDPQYRRLGIGRVLLAAVENRAWQLGYPSLSIETHAGWQASVTLYTKCGYR